MRYRTLQVTVTANGDTAYTAALQAFRELAASQVISADIKELASLGFSSAEHTFDAEFTFPDDWSNSLKIRILNLAKAMEGKSIFLSNERNGRIGVGAANLGEWVEGAFGDPIDDSTSNELRRAMTADAANSKAIERFAWDTKDIAYSALALAGLLLVAILIFTAKTGSVVTGVEKGWPILVIVALAGMPAALLFGLRTK